MNERKQIHILGIPHLLAECVALGAEAVHLAGIDGDAWTGECEDETNLSKHVTQPKQKSIQTVFRYGWKYKHFVLFFIILWVLSFKDRAQPRSNNYTVENVIPGSFIHMNFRIFVLHLECVTR